MANCIQTADAKPKFSTNIFAQYLLTRTLNMPKLEAPPTTDIDKIKIKESGITKLLNELNADKALCRTRRASTFTPQKCCQGDIYFLKDITVE